MTPAVFIAKWSRSELRERQGAQSHFNDLCALLGEPNPSDADPTGATYCFERGATKVGGGDGWADVWRRACFGWEYKGKHKDLNAALRQLQIYAPDLENPPYLVVSDMERIIVHTNWTNTIRETHVLGFDDLREPVKLDLLRQVFQGSDRLKPGLSPQELTAKVATRFGDLGKRLQERGEDPQAVAHFLNQLIFCLFAEDAELLPKGLFTRMLRNVSFEQYNIPIKIKDRFDALFMTMAAGGFFGADTLRWFNGGLFDVREALPLERDDLDMLVDTAREHDWSNLDPAILGTMFEAALKTTGRRAALGAHYTDREKILKIVEPVIVRPLAAEWRVALAAIRAEAEARVGIEARRQEREIEATAFLAARGPEAARESEIKRRKERADLLRERDGSLRRATETRDAFLHKLAAFRVLDPACGSGNFLYVALHALRDIELRALLDAERLGVPQVRPAVGLDAVLGIEIEPYAAELARVTLWIGNLQWERKNGFTDPDEPILSKLDTIHCSDALLNEYGNEAQWPEADVILGNPPFLGGKKHGTTLDLNDLRAIRLAFAARVPDSANLVVYWFQKALELLQSQKVRSVGFIATQAIRRGASNSVIRKFLDDICISDASSNEVWTNKGAAIRVSCIVFNAKSETEKFLDGIPVNKINSDLTADDASAPPPALVENLRFALQGTISGGPFEIEGHIAREMLLSPVNPNGRHNQDILRPWKNADDLTGRPSDYWIIDFGDTMSIDECSLFERPFQYLQYAWAKERERRNRAGENQLRLNEPRSLEFWWRLQRRRTRLLDTIAVRSRYIATPRVAKHRFFTWVASVIVPDTRIVVITKDDDVSFGILSSKIHENWALRFSGNHGVGNDPEYVHTLTFNAFPFPDGLTPNISATAYANCLHAQKIGAAAASLYSAREAWLNPHDLVRIEPEVVPGYPDRILPKDEAAAESLKKRTLTNLYNERPTWLANAHRALDEAVAAAYGWPTDLSDNDILARLLALNKERTAGAGR